MNGTKTKIGLFPLYGIASPNGYASIKTRDRSTLRKESSSHYLSDTTAFYRLANRMKENLWPYALL